jgi:3-hydroxymyristoyl/3-hydroxydecanoyl-(acyl carrier protein) dehydratase
VIILERSFALDHPTAAGHFPGNPIIPGALLLSETLRAIETSLALDLAQGQPVSAKFLHPVRPGENVRIECAEVRAGTLKFSCTVGATIVLTGTVTCEAAWTPA